MLHDERCVCTLEKISTAPVMINRPLRVSAVCTSEVPTRLRRVEARHRERPALRVPAQPRIGGQESPATVQGQTAGLIAARHQMPSS